MHKYFAKTLFLGKKVEYLPQCHSTNDEMTVRVRDGLAAEGDVICTNHQTKGKGQRGNVWLSQPEKNLLFSVNLTPTFLDLKEIYMINVMIGVAIQKALLEFVPAFDVEIKWPNDIYINDRKIGGVLVETILGNGALENAIVGIGLNVNQGYFSLPSATSLFVETNKEFDRDQVLETVLIHIELAYQKLRDGKWAQLKRYYHERMRWRGEVHQFRTSQGDVEGEIIGIDNHGSLVINHQSGLSRYDVKEIEFLT